MSASAMLRILRKSHWQVRHKYSYVGIMRLRESCESILLPNKRAVDCFRVALTQLVFATGRYKAYGSKSPYRVAFADANSARNGCALSGCLSAAEYARRGWKMFSP